MSYQQPPPSSNLAYPWLSQYDPNYQAEYYVNAETGETTWSRPVESQQSYSDRGFEPSPSPSGYDYSAPPGLSYPASGPPASRGAGEAASFYGSAQPSYGNSQSNHNAYSSPETSADAGPDGSGEPGERGLGKVIVAGGALWMAHKLWKDWQKSKLSSQQQSLLRPPQYAPAQQVQGYHHHAGQGQGQGQYRASQAFNPHQAYSQAPQQPQQPYGGYQQQQQQQPQQHEPPQPPSYGSGYNSYPNAPYQSQTKGFNEPVPQPSFNGAPIDSQSSYNNGGGAYDSNQYPSQPQYQYQSQQDSYQQPPPQQYQGSSSGWGDPRY